MTKTHELITPIYNLERLGFPKDTVIVRPASVDLFLSGENDETALPEEIKTHPKLVNEASGRRELYENLGELFKRVGDPKTGMDEALDSGLLRPDDLAQVYQELADFIETDENNARIILYLPFEILPRSDTESGKPEALQAAETRFRDSFKRAWRKLLSEYDVRANFVDGDILEQELRKGEPPLVVKAAHLIPELVQRGLVSVGEVIDILEEGRDEVLEGSVMETLPALADRRFIKREDWRRLLFSDNKNLLKAAFETTHSLSTEGPLSKDESDRIFELFDPKSFEGVSTHSMFAALIERLKGTAQMAELGVLNDTDADRVYDMILATMRFWRISHPSMEIGLKLARLKPEGKMGKAMQNFDSFASASSSREVEEWVSLWDKKYLQEIASKTPIDQDEFRSNEVMRVERAWGKIEEKRRETGKREKSDLIKDKEEWLSEILAQFDERLQQINEKYRSQTGIVQVMTAERVAWEWKDKKGKLVEQTAGKLARALLSGEIDPEDIVNLCNGEAANGTHSLVGAQSAVVTVETLSLENLPKAKELAGCFDEALQALWAKDHPEVREILARGWYHWVSLGVLSEDYLTKFGLKLPKLDAILPVDLENMPTRESDGLKEALRVAEETPEWSKALYPVFVVFGSRFKGYAGKAADLDAAVFVRPETNIDEREIVENAVAKTQGETTGLGGVVEFWLGEEGGKLVIRHVPQGRSTIANEDWVHVLFSGVWLGKNEEVQKLYKSLLPLYLRSDPRVASGNDARSLWLRQIEREVLQYRLMHKGFDRFFPNTLGPRTEHSPLLDSDSAFWDPMFRRIATRLFISKVFLPDLSVQEPTQV